VIAVYCVLFIPVGVLILGRNLMNRGIRVVAFVYFAASALLFTSISIAAVLGTRVPLMWIFGAAAAAFVISTESTPYSRELRRGGRKARWWPPLLWILGWLVGMTILIALFGDAEAMRNSA
jgi:hypothetical protein